MKLIVFLTWASKLGNSRVFVIVREDIDIEVLNCLHSNKSCRVDLSCNYNQPVIYCPWFLCDLD